MTIMIGPASLLESDDRPAWWTPPGRPHRLEALVGSDNGDGTLAIHHYFCGQHRPDNPWLRGDTVSTAALGPAALSQRGRPGSRGHELVAHIPETAGVREYAWSVNDARYRRWRKLGLVEVETPATPAWDGPEDAIEWGTGTVLATAIARTRLKSGWIQALVQVDGSLYHLHRQARAGSVRWVRHACLRLADPEPFLVAGQPSGKVAQISGERDSQPAAPGGTGRRTLSRSESRSGVRGTDLGVRVDHGGRTFLMFGDTHWRRPWLATRDAIAEVVNADADLPEVTFHGSPMSVRGGRTTLREYDVPLDAFSLDGELFAFFSSDHFRNAQVMGRSVLTRAEPSALRIDPRARRRPLRFRHLATLSDRRFINVSVQRRGDHLLLWGSGGYRADELRLARVDLTAPGVAEGLARGSGAEFLAALEFWAGPLVEPVETPSPLVEPVETPDSAHSHHWSSSEADARPLLSPGAHGEVSVRWVPEVRRFLMLTMSGPEDPIGAAVVLRTAPQAWGPWSPRLKLFDWVAAGMSFGDASRRFIRSSLTDDDPVGDAVFRGQANATGAAYAPYLFDARVRNGRLVLRYTLSTWNPYQVVLMQQHLSVDDPVVTSHLV